VSESLPMPLKVEDITAVKKKLFFDIPWVDVKKELDSCYRTMGTKAKIKGFRPGKVPRNILESLYRDHIEGEVISNLINRYYWDAIKGEGIHVISQPDIDQKGIDQDSNFKFEATVEVEPFIEPKGYIALGLDKQMKDVTDADVETRLEQIRHIFGTMEEITDSREVRNGDFAVIDFTGYLDDEPLKEMTSEDYLLEVGSGTFIPGFEDNVIGMTKDQTKRIELKFPDDYRDSRLAGKEVSFSITLKSIKKKVLPEIDETFIRNFNKYETLDDLKADIRNNLEEENRNQSETLLHNDIVTKLLEINEFEAPPTLVEKQIYYMLAETRREMMSRGMDRRQIDELGDAYKEMYRDEATKIVKSVLLLKNIAAKESVTADAEEIDAKIREMALRRGQDFESFKTTLENNDMIEGIISEIINKKVFEFIIDKAKINLIQKEQSHEGGK
jgi:trigger factor